LPDNEINKVKYGPEINQ